MSAAADGKCAVVTGAGRGIGRAVALALGQRGFSVALLARTRSELLEVARTFAAESTAGARALVIPCDVSRPEDVHAAAIAVLEALGTPQVVVNGAGIVRRSRTEDTTDEDWNAVLAINLTGTFRVARAFLPAMRLQGRGRIVNVASISATLGTAGQTAYNASKWGVVGFTKSLAEELRGSGLQTMAVLPGSVDTDMLKGSGFAPQMTAGTVAEALVYAALDAPDAMNGSAVEIFGA